MKIKKITSYLVEIPYKHEYKTSSNITLKGRHVVVRIDTDAGIVGWGETGIISKRYPMYGDSPESMFANINAHFTRDYWV